jgi:hypothetical protein
MTIATSVAVSSIPATVAGRSTTAPQDAQYGSLGRCAAPQMGQNCRLSMTTYSSVHATRIGDVPRFNPLAGSAIVGW